MTAFVTEHITPFITAGHSVKVEREKEERGRDKEESREGEEREIGEGERIERWRYGDKERYNGRRMEIN